MLERLSDDELDAWRDHPVTRLLVRELNGMEKALETELRVAAGDATIDRVRYVAGELYSIARVQMLIQTEGDEQ